MSATPPFGTGKSVAIAVAPLAIGVAFAMVLHAVVAPAVGPFAAKILLDIGIAIVLAVSLNIVNGFAGQFSLGHGGFMMVGGYVSGAITYYGSLLMFGESSVHGGFLGSGELLFLAASVAGGLVAAALGAVVGLPSLRLRGDYLAIVTLGFGEIARVLFQLTDPVLLPDAAKQAGAWQVMRSLGGALGFGGIPTYASVFYSWIFVALVLIVAFRLKYSTHGRSLLAIRENEIAAEAMGIDTAKAKVTAFLLAAYFAGMAGALFAHELGTTLNAAELGFQRSIDVVIIVVLGGLGSISGAVVAAIVLTILPELFREFSQYRMIVYALALIFMMIARPQGLFGVREVWELPVWRKLRTKRST